jgi:redox-sensing transcriptional repressor
VEIPVIAIRRLCEIVRLLERLTAGGRELIFSNEIGEKTGIPPYQVRKDISYLGEIGTPGRGYNIRDLLDHILTALDLKVRHPAVLVGVGRLGSALLNYVNLATSNITYVAAFDNDPRKIGHEENGVPIMSMADLAALLKKRSVATAVLTVPHDSAQAAFDQLVAGGVTAVLNFAPVSLIVPEGVVVRNIDFSLEIKALTAVRVLKHGAARRRKKE